MTDRDFEITDFVSSRQHPTKPTLRRALEFHHDDIEPVEHETTENHAVRLDEDLYLWERKEDLPEELPAANYVVVDAIYFCTTAIEILAAGANRIQVRESHEEVEKHGLDDPKIRIGGEKGDGYEPREGYDFFNSPSFIQELDLEDHDVMMTSDNGAVAALKIKEVQPDAKVYLGSTTNAMAIARKLRDSPEPIHIVCSGRRGTPNAEDHITAFLICKHLAGRMTSEERDRTSELLQNMKEFYYEEPPDRRKLDIQEYVADINRHNIVPEMASVEEGGYSFIIPE